MKFIFPSLLIVLIDTCARKQLLKLHLAVEIDIVEVVYYLMHVFHLLYYESLIPAELLLCFSSI